MPDREKGRRHPSPPPLSSSLFAPDRRGISEGMNGTAEAKDFSFTKRVENVNSAKRGKDDHIRTTDLVQLHRFHYCNISQLHTSYINKGMMETVY